MKSFSWVRILAVLAPCLALPLSCAGDSGDDAGGDGDGDAIGDGDGDGDTIGTGDGDAAGDGDAGDGDATSGGSPGDGDTSATGGDGGMPSGGGASSGGANASSGSCSDQACEGNCEPTNAEATTCEDAWTCSTQVACSRDLVSYCGCDGKTFEGSSNCAPFAYAHLGACEDGTSGGLNCDASQVVTPEPPPSCEYGYLAQVIDGDWGQCVPIGECGCESSGSQDQCGPLYVCYNSGRCGDLLR